MDDKIEKYCFKHGEPAEDLSCPEELFLRAYACFLKRKTRIREFVSFDFSPLEYFNVSEYLGFEAGQDIIYNSVQWPRDVQSGKGFDNIIAYYQLQYVIDTIGNEKLSEIVEEMIEAKQFNLFERLSKVLGRDIATIYSPLEKLPPDQVKLGPAEQARFKLLRKWRLSNLSGKILHRAERMIKLEELCSHPILIDFDKKERSEIINTIYAMGNNEFVHNYNGIGYFLANFILHETEWSFKEILPLAIYLMTETPIKNPDSSTASNVSWFCSEIIERCYKLLPDDQTIQKHYRDLIYQIYWPRIGSLWPLLHWKEIEFRDNFKRLDLIEAASYVLNLEDIENRNSEVTAYIKSFPNTSIEHHCRNENEDLFYCGLRHNKDRIDDSEQDELKSPAKPNQNGNTKYAALRAKTMAFQSSEIAPMFKKPYIIKSNKEKK